MTAQSLDGKKILVLVANGVDEAGMSTIQRDLLKAKAKVYTVSADAAVISSWNGQGWGVNFPTDANVNVTLGSDYDILVVPAGGRSTQTLGASAHAERIISSFIAAKKPMGFVGSAFSLLEKMGYTDAKDYCLQVEEAKYLAEALANGGAAEVLKEAA